MKYVHGINSDKPISTRLNSNVNRTPRDKSAEYPPSILDKLDKQRKTTPRNKWRGLDEITNIDE
jgi:hypothetical protein